MRVVAPQALDFAAVADGVLRNNVGVVGMHLEADVRCAGARVQLIASDQSFALDGAAPADGWRRFAVHDWDDPASTVLVSEPAPAASSPAD